VSQSRNAEVLLAFDFGLRRLGIATGNLRTRTATALTTLACSGRTVPWAAIDAIVSDYTPGRLIVGRPEGSTGPTSVAVPAMRFARALAERYALPVDTVDETLTSAEAASALREERRAGRLKRRVGKDDVDSEAARLILEQWLSSNPREND
jgi:putative holliday junction resolvase